MAKEKSKSREGTDKVSQNTSNEQITARGRIFEGFVTKKFPKRVVVEFERTVYVRKYERSYRKSTRLHARLPKEMEDKINVGDYIKIRETRPLSKIINFIVIEKIRSSSNNNHSTEAKK